METNFEHQECVIVVQSTKIGTHENKAIHSMLASVLRLWLASSWIPVDHSIDVI